MKPAKEDRSSDPVTYPLETVRVAPLGSTRSVAMLAAHVE